MYKKYTKFQRAVLWVVFVFFMIYAISLLYPFFWALINSLKSQAEFSENSFSLPAEVLFSNFSKAFQELKVGNVNFINIFTNSILYTALSTALAVLSSSVAAYVVSKYDFKLKNFFYALAIFSMIIPVVGALPSQYRLVKGLNLDTIPGMAIVSSGGFGFNFILLYGFFKAVSWSYAEAAFVDGASDFKVFVNIMIPQAKPAFVAIFIITAIGVWNDYMTPLIFLEWRSPVLSFALFEFRSIYENTKTTLFLAGNLIATIPLIIIFIAFNNTIVENTVAGGLKG